MRFLGIDEGFDADESVEFLDEVGVTYEQFVDADGAFAVEMDIAELPATVVIDADGEVIYRHLGDLSYDDIVAVLADIPRLSQRTRPIRSHTLSTDARRRRPRAGGRGGRRGRRRCGCGGRTWRSSTPS